jgi:hypothetical protein
MEEFTTEEYKTFTEIVSKKDFDKHLRSMEQNDMLCFLRASLMYQRAIKCRACDSDIAITLLCSAVEVVSGGKPISYNFRRFLLTYCPEELRNPPVKILKGKGENFEVAVRAIYSNFRSLHLHRGIGYMGMANKYKGIADKPYIDKKTGEHIHMVGIPLLLKADGNIISVELTRITDWFASVVKNSLFRYLTSEKRA